MLLGTRIAKNKLMTHKIPQARIISSQSVQDLVTLTILSLTLILSPISQAQTFKTKNSGSLENPLNKGSEKSAEAIGSAEVKKQLSSFEINVKNQIKLDLNRRTSIGINGLFALKGGDSSGGGNPEEVKFIATALQIQNWLNLAPDFVKTQFGFGIEVFTESIRDTQISCASDPYLSYIRKKGKKAFFIQPLKTVFLDCEKFSSLTVDTEAFRGLVFHEYMRSAGIEGENVYKYSSQINWMITSAYEISNSPVYGNYDATVFGEAAAVYYRGRKPIYRSASKYGSETYIYDIELTKESEGIWVGEGYILDQFRMMPCYYQVRVRYQIIYGYQKPVAYVQVTLPANLSDRLDRNEQTGKLTCPVNPVKIKSLTFVKQD